MKRAIPWAAPVFALLALSAVRADDAKVTGDLKKLQGTWVSASAEGPDIRWEFEGEKLKAKVGDNEYVCSVKLDEKATPHPTADLTIKEGPGDAVGKTSKAIYKFDGDKVVFCVTTPGNDNRPTEFKASPDESHLFELKKK